MIQIDIVARVKERNPIVLMPVGAFIDSDIWAEEPSQEDDQVLMPVGAFIDSDQASARPGRWSERELS